MARTAFSYFNEFATAQETGCGPGGVLDLVGGPPDSDGLTDVPTSMLTARRVPIPSMVTILVDTCVGSVPPRDLEPKRVLAPSVALVWPQPVALPPTLPRGFLEPSPPPGRALYRDSPAPPRFLGHARDFGVAGAQQQQLDDCWRKESMDELQDLFEALVAAFPASRLSCVPAP